MRRDGEGRGSETAEGREKTAPRRARDDEPRGRTHGDAPRRRDASAGIVLSAVDAPRAYRARGAAMRENDGAPAVRRAARRDVKSETSSPPTRPKH